MTSKNKEGYAKACHLDAKMSVLAYPFLTIASRQNYITSLRGERYKTFMNKTMIDDGFNAELVTNAFFDGIILYHNAQNVSTKLLQQILTKYN